MKKKGRSGATKGRWQVFGLLGIGFWLVLGVVLAIISIKYKGESEKQLPKIEIFLNGVELKEIDEGSKEVKYEGNNLRISYMGVTDNYQEVVMKGRGNGTWGQDKKPYQIKFKDKVDLFGLGKTRKWYLLANAMDETNLRTEAAVYLEEMLGMKYVFKGEFVELYVDNDYRGLYYLTHAVEVSKTGVDLKDDFGVLIELDNMYGKMEDYYETGNGDKLVIKDLVNEDEREEAMVNFLESYNAFEAAVIEGDYEKIMELIDVESFAQYYLLSEFTVNPDAYGTSFYFYKDGDLDKIHAGPGWDFDLVFGNRNWKGWIGEDFYSPTESMVRKREIMSEEEYEEKGIGKEGYDSSLDISHIIYDLMEISEFREEAKRIFNERLSGRKMELIFEIYKKAKEIRESAEKNNEKWEEEDYWGEVVSMLDWIEKRFNYFEKEYGDGSGAKRQGI